MSESGEAKKITLDSFLEDDLWWENDFKDTSQIPLDFVREPKTIEAEQNTDFVYDPYNKIVGHEKEKAASKAVVKDALKTFAYIKKRWNELRASGLKENDPPGHCIIDILREEVPPMPMIIRIGPYGSSKSLQQRCEEDFLFREREKYGLHGYDYYTISDYESPLGFSLRQTESPRGQVAIDNYFFKKENRANLFSFLKWTGISVAGLAIAGAMAELVTQYWWESQLFGENPLEWVATNMATVLPYIEDLVFIAGVPTALALFKKWINKNKSDDPSLLSTGGEMAPTYVGHETVDKLCGEYTHDSDAPAQFRLKLGDILKANEKMLTIENLHSLSPDVQKNLSQIIEEKVVDVADLPREYRKFVYTLISAGINTDKLSSVVESLQNRINYADILNVVNNVSRDEEQIYSFPETNTTISVDSGKGIKRNKKNERHLALLLGDIADHMGGRPWKKEAYQEFVDYCSRLADNSGELHISRRVIKLPKKAEDFAEAEKSKYVEQRHVAMAERELKSITQSVMERKLLDYAVEQMASVDNTQKIGRVNVALSYHDNLLKGMEPGTPLEIYDYIQTEDYIGYVAPITAVKESTKSDESSLEIITKDKTLDKAFLKNALLSMLAKEGKDLHGSKLYVSVPSLKDDDAILGGAYVAVRSVLENRPVKQDSCLATKVTEAGEVSSIPRLNSRLFYLDGKTREVVVSGYDKTHKIEDRDGKSLYPSVKFTAVDNLENLYGSLVSS